MTAQKVYDHIADFIAGLDPKRVLELKAPESMRIRLEELITKEKEGILLEGEKDELDHYLVLERLIRLAKAHARMRVMPS